MKNPVFLLSIILLIVACNRNEPKIVYDNNESGVENLPDLDNDNYKKLIADLPFTFDSLDYFYFPVGKTDESFNMNLRSYTKSYLNGNESYSLGYVGNWSLNCNLDNLLIRTKNDSKYSFLTKSELKIKSINYLFRIDTIHNIDRLLFRIIDTDSNKDKEINDDDLVGLFSSKTSGKDLKRLSPENHQLIDWETHDLQGILFFRTMEDIDKNGEFNEHDRINLYEYNLLKEDSIKLILNSKLYDEIE